jgi:putative transcriptional regulator
MIYVTFRNITSIWGFLMEGNKNIKLKMARVEKGYSQEQLADELGVTRQTIGLIEAGNYNPTIRLCTAICRALEKTLNDLFWEEEK